MVSYLTALWWKGDPDEKDAVTGMSRRDVYNVQKSWAAIYANAHENGFLVFTRMFDKDPETKTFFKFLSGASKDEMWSSVVFRAHIVNLTSAFDAAVRNLSQQPSLSAQLLKKIGDTHRPRMIRRKHFQVFREVLLDILKNDLALSEPVLVSWEHFVEFMLKYIFETLTE